MFLRIVVEKTVDNVNNLFESFCIVFWGVYMLHIFKSFPELNIEQLLNVYSQIIMENSRALSSDFSEWERRIKAEDDFISYVREEFFKQTEAVYAVWSSDGSYKAVLRLEPYSDDGLLLEALETAPEARKQGYAFLLMNEVIAHLQSSKWNCVYSHVHKRNIPSLKLHEKCGFQKISDSAKFIDGSVSQLSCTFCYYLKKSIQ